MKSAARALVDAEVNADHESNQSDQVNWYLTVFQLDNNNDNICNKTVTGKEIQTIENKCWKSVFV